MYPIADNDTPQLAADRLEYSLSNACITYPNIVSVSLDQIAAMYNDLIVQINEHGVDELGFQIKKLARDFVRMTSKLSVSYRDDPTRYSMQLIADILKRSSDDGLIAKADMYTKSEEEVIALIERSRYGDIWRKWSRATRVRVSTAAPSDNVYYVRHPAKVRYINPLVNGERIADVCKIARQLIDNNLSYDMSNYVWIDGIEKF